MDNTLYLRLLFVTFNCGGGICGAAGADIYLNIVTTRNKTAALARAGGFAPLNRLE